MAKELGKLVQSGSSDVQSKKDELSKKKEEEKLMTEDASKGER